jgi:CheY-like chemotaxis protein
VNLQRRSTLAFNSANNRMILPEHAVILIAEDLEADVFLIRRALAAVGVQNPIHVVRDGEECLAYMHGSGKYANRDEYPLPDLLLLDLKMPRVDGFEVLCEIRGHKAFAALPIIVLTSSEQIFDVNKAYDIGANSFLVKPLEFENLTALMRTLSSFWLHQNKSPLLERPPKTKEGNGQGGGPIHSSGK